MADEFTKRTPSERKEILSKILVGAGGHGQVVADILLRVYEGGARWKPIGFLDDDSSLIGTAIMGLPVLGNISGLREVNHDAIVVTIGNNRTRAQIFRSAQEEGERFVNAVHPTAVLAQDVRLGEGVMVCAHAVVNTGTVIGDNVILNTGCTVDHHNHIASHTHVAPGGHLGGNVRLGEGAMIGIGSAVIPGRFVGEWAVVGAGAAVVKDIPPHSTAVGVPAR